MIDLDVEGGSLEVVIWRFGCDFKPSDEHRIRVRDLIDEALEGDRLPGGSVDSDKAAQGLLQALEAEVEHLRRALASSS